MHSYHANRLQARCNSHGLLKDDTNRCIISLFFEAFEIRRQKGRDERQFHACDWACDHFREEQSIGLQSTSDSRPGKLQRFKQTWTLLIRRYNWNYQKTELNIYEHRLKHGCFIWYWVGKSPACDDTDFLSTKNDAFANTELIYAIAVTVR